jgi:hypothetical protein
MMIASPHGDPHSVPAERSTIILLPFLKVDSIRTDNQRQRVPIGKRARAWRHWSYIKMVSEDAKAAMQKLETALTYTYVASRQPNSGTKVVM